MEDPSILSVSARPGAGDLGPPGRRPVLVGEPGTCPAAAHVKAAPVLRGDAGPGNILGTVSPHLDGMQNGPDGSFQPLGLICLRERCSVGSPFLDGIRLDRGNCQRSTRRAAFSAPAPFRL